MGAEVVTSSFFLWLTVGGWYHRSSHLSMDRQLWQGLEQALMTACGCRTNPDTAYLWFSDGITDLVWGTFQSVFWYLELITSFLIKIPTQETVHAFLFVCLFAFVLFLMWMNCKVLSEFVTILLLFYVLVPCPRGMWNPCSLIRDQTCTPCIGKQSLNHWTIREVPCLLTWLYLFKMIWKLPTRIYHKVISGDVPGGDSAGDTCLVSGPEKSHVPWSKSTRVPQLLSPRASTTEPVCPNYWSPWA